MHPTLLIETLKIRGLKFRYFIVLVYLIIASLGRLSAQTAFIANYLDNTISVIDVSTAIVSSTINVGSAPYGVSVSQDGSKVFVTNANDSTVSVINTSTNAVTATITVGSNPHGITVSPDGSTVYVTDRQSVV